MKHAYKFALAVLVLVGAVALAQTQFAALLVRGQSDLRGAIVNGAGNVTVTDNFDVDIGAGDPEIVATDGDVEFPGNVNLVTTLELNSDPGAAGEVLTSNGMGVAPSWQAGGGLAQVTGNFVAPFATGCTVDANIGFQYAVTGDIVTFTWENDSCTSDSTSFSSAAGTVPVAARPAAERASTLFRVTDNGTAADGCLLVGADGSLEFVVASATCNAPGTWTASGSKSVRPASFTFNITTPP